MNLRSIVCLLLLTEFAFCQSAWTTAKTEELDEQSTIAGMHFTPAQLEKLKQSTRNELAECKADPFQGHSVESVFQQMRIKKVDLAPTQTGYVIQASDVCMCGVVGNCSFWILDDNFNVILKYKAQTFAIADSSTNGSRDIVLTLHSSATESIWSLYRFTGTYYRRVQCAFVDYAPTPDVILKKPDVAVLPCSTLFGTEAK